MIGGDRIGRMNKINNFRIKAVRRGLMLVMHNRDVPGVIGRVGTILGDAGINISAFTWAAVNAAAKRWRWLRLMDYSTSRR